MKILKNNGASPVTVTDTGITIGASSSYTIPVDAYDLWAASSDVVTAVGDATLVVNDGTNDLTIAPGIGLIKLCKIITNYGVSDVTVMDTGITVVASSSYTIPPQDYWLWAASADIVTKVGDGDLVVNNGSSDLSISDGISFIQGLEPVNGSGTDLAQIQLIAGGDATGSPTIIGRYFGLQEAVDAIPAGTTSDTIRTVYTLLIPPGTYDEDLTIDVTNRHINFTALGPVNIGLFNNAFWAASNTRNITIINTAGTVDSIRCGFSMGTYLPFGDSGTTHQSYMTAFRVSGSLIVSTMPAGFTDVEFSLAAEFFGDIDTSAFATHDFQFFLTRCRVRGQIKGTRNRIQLADWCVFNGLVTALNYSTIRNCVFDSGMTVGSATGGGFKPYGIIATDFSGTFTGPANSMELDGTSLYFFTANGASLAGGATQVLLESGGGSGITQLTGDVTAGPGSGSQVATIGALKVTTGMIQANAVTNAKLATMAANTVKANITGGSAVPTDAALLTTATNNSVAQRDSSGDLTATVMRSATFKPADGAGTAATFTSGSAASNAAGGNVTLSSAVGSSVSTGGAGGSLNVTAGAANGDGTVDRAGGSITLTAGASKGSSQGGGLTVNLGTGGAGTGTAGATGGTGNYNAGTGGIGSATSGAGGNITLNAGTGGAGVAGGNGGSATLHGGNAGTGSASAGNGGAANVSGGSAGSFAGSSGGSVSLAGAGGSSTGAGGAGGTATITGGAAGGDNTANNSGGSITLTAGTSKGSSAGPNVNITAGTGGVGTGTAGANGGSLSFTGGSAGAGSATGGNGGTAQITGGSSAASAGSAGGQIILAGATGTGTGSGGAGGNAQLNGGNANGDSTVDRAGGNVTLTCGNSKGSATGGVLTFTGGTGGVGTGTAGAAGGAWNATAGAGGVGSASGGAGGTITISAGTGGASGTPGAGGNIIFRTALTTSITEHFRVGNDGHSTVTAGDLKIATAGNGLQVKGGANCKINTAVLVAGTVTVANTAVTANSRIFLTSQVDGGTPGFLRITAKTAGTSFVITSSNAADTSTVAWMIVESI